MQPTESVRVASCTLTSVNPALALVRQVRAGHEVRQERRRVLADLLEVLCFPVGDAVELQASYG